MAQLGKILISGGLAMLILGAFVWTASKVGFRGMPGDIRYEGDRTNFHFPIVTCLIISVLMTGFLALAGWLWGLWNR